MRGYLVDTLVEVSEEDVEVLLKECLHSFLAFFDLKQYKSAFFNLIFLM